MLCLLRGIKKRQLKDELHFRAPSQWPNRVLQPAWRDAVVRSFVLGVAVSISAIAPATAAQPSANAGPRPVSRAELIKTLDAKFAAADTDHDGSLSLAEIQAAEARDLQAAQARRKAQIEAEFRRLDTNKDGQLSLAEFSAAIPDVRASETPQQILQRYDANHDGKVSPEEFRSPQLRAFDAADLNHDGVVTPDELRRFQAQQKK